jgi:hypothetical protein
MIVGRLTQKIEKKYKFGLHALAYFIVLFLKSTGRLEMLEGNVLLVAMLVITTLSIFLIHYPNISLKNSFMAFLLPVTLAYGGTLSLMYFPNVSIAFKLIAILAFTLLDYIVLLIDNIFLVVEDREELIPLYRVAVTWSLIIQIVVLIPLVASIYKININSVYQALLVSGTSFLYTIYQIWATRYDKDAKNVGIVERVFLSFIVFFFVLSSVLSVSFIPSEPFLKALFTATVTMFGIGYVSGYLKNEINKKYVVQYTIMISFFLVLMLIFRP